MLNGRWLLAVSVVLALSGIATAGPKKKEAPRISTNTFPDCTLVGDNLVTNCGFETGDFTGWTQSGDLSSTSVSDSPHSGAFAAHLGPVYHLGLLTQTVTPAAGSVCLLSFWMSNSGRAAEFEVWWNSSRISQVTNVPDMAYTQFTYTGLLSANGDDVDLTFAFFNYPSYIDLDDIVVECF